MTRRIISIINPHSELETGFSTQCLAQALVEQAYQVTVIDCNPKAELSYSLDMAEHDGLDSVLLKDRAIDKVTVAVADNFNFIPAGQQLEDVEQIATGGAQRAKKLTGMLEHPLMKQQDFILIEAPEKQGLLMLNVLFAGDEVLASSMTCYTSLQDLVTEIRAFKRVKSVVGNATKFWLVLTQTNVASTLTEQITNKILDSFPSKVFKTMLTKADNDLTINTEMTKSIREDYFQLAQDVVFGRTN